MSDVLCENLTEEVLPQSSIKVNNKITFRSTFIIKIMLITEVKDLIKQFCAFCNAYFDSIEKKIQSLLVKKNIFFKCDLK